MGEQAAAAALRFTWERTTDAVRGVYDDVLAANASR
jgi:hypothetical protein